MGVFNIYHTYERTDVYQVEAATAEEALDLFKEDPGECIDKIDGREFGIEAEEVTGGN